jgi:superfamily II DNA/RNA helicase
MRNFELIDDYLSNRLKGAEKEAFDKQLATDPTLKSDLDFQKQIVEGIKNARASELKSMLNKVPVGGAGITVDFQMVRMAAGLVATGVVGAAIYFYVTRGELPPFDKAATDFGKKTGQIAPEEKPQQDSNTTPEANTPETSTPAVKEEESKKESKPEVKKNEEIKPAEKPKLDVTDPSQDVNSEDNAKSNEPTTLRRTEITASHIAVELDSSNKKYDFHYQFAGNKLMLYGSFDKSLYEVLEVNGDNHAVFLFYKDAYYLLDERQSKITKLEPIKDSSLIGKLRDYRRK